MLTFYISGVAIVAVAAVIGALASGAGRGGAGRRGRARARDLAGLVKRQATRYVITTERLHIRRGILAKKTQETRSSGCRT